MERTSVTSSCICKLKFRHWKTLDLTWVWNQCPSGSEVTMLTAHPQYSDTFSRHFAVPWCLFVVCPGLNQKLATAPPSFSPVSQAPVNLTSSGQPAFVLCYLWKDFRLWCREYCWRRFMLLFCLLQNFSESSRHWSEDLRCRSSVLQRQLHLGQTDSGEHSTYQVMMISRLRSREIINHYRVRQPCLN